MLYRNRRNLKFIRLKRAVLILFMLIILFIVYIESCISKFTPNYIRIRAEALSSNIVCDSVDKILNKHNYEYADIADLKYATDGKVQSITTDSVKINRLKAEVTKTIQKEMEKLYDNQVDIPLGVFTNISAFSNYGPCIPVNFNLTGSFSSEIISTFEEAGVNQTIHHIKLILNSKIITTTPDDTGIITFTTDYEIAQSVIVGEIPSTYGSLYKTY